MQTLLKRKVGIWILTTLLVIFFLVAGTAKLRGAWHIAANFAAQGFSMEFMYLVGVAEIAVAIGLLAASFLFKRYRHYFVQGLSAITLFTAISSARVQLWDATIVAVIVLGLTLLLAWLLKSQPKLTTS